MRHVIGTLKIWTHPISGICRWEIFNGIWWSPALLEPYFLVVLRLITDTSAFCMSFVLWAAIENPRVADFYPFIAFGVVQKLEEFPTRSFRLTRRFPPFFTCDHPVRSDVPGIVGIGRTVHHVTSSNSITETGSMEWPPGERACLPHWVRHRDRFLNHLSTIFSWFVSFDRQFDLLHRMASKESF